MNPLVTVICLCYNHEKFIEEAVNSILEQDYNNIEIIIADDFSQDTSREIIKKIADRHSSIRMILNEKNLGNCKAFNNALAMAKGKYIVDFATDDVMVSNRVSKQVEAFERMGEEYGVVYTNVLDIDEQGNPIALHQKEDKELPSGNIYINVLERYFISPPSMMMRKKVFDELGGYDESLAYEDFDFWVRSSRNYKYYYIKEVLCHKRILRNSKSAQFHRKDRSYVVDTTIRICRKALWLNKSEEENKALAKRINYEMMHAFRMEYFDQVKKFYALLQEMDRTTTLSTLIKKAAGSKLRIHWLYSYYIKLRYPHQHS